MKKIVLSALVATMLGTVAFAQSVPVTDIAEGQSRINAEYSFAQDVKGDHGHDDGFGASIQTGLSDKLAAQYSYSKVNADNIGDVKNHEANLVYKLSNNVNVYGGATMIDSNSNNYGVQAGLIGHVPLTDRVKGYAKVGVGDDVKNTYQVGATYALANNWDLNAYYGYEKFDSSDKDTTVKGLHAGVGYSF